VPPPPRGSRRLDADVADLLRWLGQGAQDRGILAQKMGVPDRRMRKAIEEARRRGELVIVTRPGPLHLYALARSRSEFDEWKRHELMSRRVYATREEAKRHQPKMRVYRCPICDRYHTRSRISRRQICG